jgi:hypothetical protein
VEGRRLALVVAVDRYDDPGLRDLAAPAADASALAEVLADPALGNFSVETVSNETTAVVAERVEAFLSELRPADFALLHFSCHGLKDDSGELYLAARNTKIDRLASTGFDAALVDRLMRRSRSQQIVLLLDCCYGGAFQRGVVSRAGGSAGVGEQFHQEALGAGRGRVVITASTAMEFAFEGSDLADTHQGAPSVFSGAVVEGLRSGDADRDEDGRVSLTELYEFVYDEVKRRSPQQTPSKWEYGVQGNLFIAGTPRRRIRPRKLPDDLLELIQHGHASVRMSAVSELARLVEGDDLPFAAAAHAALVSLAEDDSRRVCLAAQEVLNASQLRLPVEHHDFGQLGQGTAAPAFTVTLVGPPLVQVAEVVSSSRRVRATLRGRSLTVTPETSTAGLLDADVSVSSPAGGATLHVRADIRAPVMESGDPPRANVTTGMSSSREPGLLVDRTSPEPFGADAGGDPLDATRDEALRRRHDDGKGPFLRLFIIVAVLLAIGLGVTIYFARDTSLDGYGPPSETFEMGGPWTLRAVSATQRACFLKAFRPDGDAEVASTLHADSTVGNGEFVRTVRVDEVGKFVLHWAEGHEDECRAQVVENVTGARQTITPPGA